WGAGARRVTRARRSRPGSGDHRDGGGRADQRGKRLAHCPSPFAGTRSTRVARTGIAVEGASGYESVTTSWRTRLDSARQYPCLASRNRYGIGPVGGIVRPRLGTNRTAEGVVGGMQPSGGVQRAVDCNLGRADGCQPPNYRPPVGGAGASCHHPEGSQAAATETVTSCHTPPLTFRPFPVACPDAWSPT